MSRSVSEWIAKHDDTPIPPRVRDRVARKADDCCQQCRRPIVGKLRAEFDHIVPLILGGENREANIQCLCADCHSEKSKLDVRLKAKIARVRAKHLGLRAKRNPFPGSRASGFRKRMNGTVERRS
jgi:5-methylcytosine-specific restriction protein A